MEEYTLVTKIFAIRWNQDNLDDIRRALIPYDPDIEISLEVVDPTYAHLKLDNLFVMPGEWIVMYEEPDGRCDFSVMDHYAFIGIYKKKV